MMSPKPTYEELANRVAELEAKVSRYQSEEHKRTPDILPVLMATFRYIPRCKTFGDAAKEIFRQCKRFTGARSGYVALLSEDGEENEVLFLDAGGLPCDVDPELPMPIRGLREVAYRTKEVACDNDFANSQWTAFMPQGHVRLDNVLFAPLNVEGKTIGIIGIANKPGGFNDQDVQVAKILGDLAAVALTYAKAQDSLREGEERYRWLFNNINDAIYIHKILPNGKPGRFLQTNNAASAMLGFTTEEFKAMSPRELDDPDKSFHYIPLVMKQLQQDKVATFEAVQITKDGRPIDVEVSAVVRDLGSSEYILSVCRNISERKRLEEQLIQKDQFLEAIYNGISHSIFVVDVLAENEFRYAGLNPQHEVLTGIPNDSILGKTPHDFLPEKDALAVMEHYRDCVHANQPITYEEWLPFRGNPSCWETTLHPQMSKTGHVNRIIGTSQEITKRKQMEVSLRESEERYRTMMESMDESAYICSSDFHVQYMNPAMIRKIGRDATGEFCYQAIHGLESQCDWCDHHKIMGGETIKKDLTKSDTGETFFVSHSPIYHTNGSVSKLTIYRDITEQKKLEARIQQAQKMESIGTLAGGIAHDFNNILFPIVGMSEMLLDDLPPESVEYENALEIFKAGQRGSDLVKQILAFSRQSEHKLVPVRIQKILGEALKLMRSTIPSNIKINQYIQNDCGVINADMTQIHQIVINLITNAYHAVADTNGEISVALKETYLGNSDLLSVGLKAGGYAEITVSDTGSGIHSEILGKIFEPYFTTKEQGKGTGLGLAVVHGIVKAYGGDIKVDSQLGVGTTFSIYFPLLVDREKRSSAKALGTLPTGVERILLVDDEKPVIKLEKQMLERLGYRVTGLTNSLEALKTFTATPLAFDLVVSDMAMPNMTGDQLAKELLAIRPDIPIVICTGFSDKMDNDRAHEIGVKGFLMKPVVKSEMANMIRNILDEA